MWWFRVYVRRLWSGVPGWNRLGRLMACSKAGAAQLGRATCWIGRRRAAQAPWHAVTRTFGVLTPSFPIRIYAYFFVIFSVASAGAPSFQAKNAKFEEVMARLQSAFSPRQVARLLLWVSANRAHIAKLPLLSKDMLQRQQQRGQQHQPGDGNGSGSSAAPS